MLYNIHSGLRFWGFISSDCASFTEVKLKLTKVGKKSGKGLRPVFKIVDNPTINFN